MIPTKKTIGQYFANIVVLLLVLWVAWAFISGAFARWQLGRAKARAETAEAAARIERANAQGARAGAQIATDTRGRIDTLVVEVRDKTAQRADRIEQHADPDADTGKPDPDVLRDLEDAEAEYRAAASRLQRPRTR